MTINFKKIFGYKENEVFDKVRSLPGSYGLRIRMVVAKMLHCAEFGDDFELYAKAEKEFTSLLDELIELAEINKNGN